MAEALPGDPPYRAAGGAFPATEGDPISGDRPGTQPGAGGRAYGGRLIQRIDGPDGRSVRRYGSPADGAPTVVESGRRYFRGDPTRPYGDAYYTYGGAVGTGLPLAGRVIDDALTGAAVAAGADAALRRYHEPPSRWHPPHRRPGPHR